MYTSLPASGQLKSKLMEAEAKKIEELSVDHSQSTIPLAARLQHTMNFVCSDLSVDVELQTCS